MADVAAVAGVSRQTLYNEFGSKDALAQALALRETQRLLADIEAAMTGHAGRPAEAVGVAVAHTLRQGANNPLLKAVLTDDAGGLLPFLTTRAEPVLTAARAHISSYVRGHWPELPGNDVDLVGEVVVRLTVSHMVLTTEPAEATAQRIALLVARLLPSPAPPARSESSCPRTPATRPPPRRRPGTSRPPVRPGS